MWPRVGQPRHPCENYYNWYRGKDFECENHSVRVNTPVRIDGWTSIMEKSRIV